MFGKPRSLEMRCLGPPAVLVDGEEPAADVMWRKHVALLAYLALSPQHTRSRDHLMGLLWPEKDQARARHSLNEAVRRLRAALGAKRLISRGDAITLSGEQLRVDALGDGEGDGEFLDGLSLPDAPAFEQWLEQERARLRNRSLSSLIDSGEQALSTSEFEVAQTVAQRALGIDAEAEAAVRLQMRASALSGDSSGALITYRDFARHIEREYSVPPSKELRALAERIREGRWRRASLVHTDAEPPLVGREREHNRAFTELSMALAQGPRVLVVSALAGRGKTRLLSECVNRWRLEGGMIALANPLGTDPGTPWSTLRQLMRGGLFDAPGLAATDPTALRMLASVVPRLAERFEPMSGLGHTDIGNALGGLFEAIAEETPLAVVIDDAHLADEATLSALRGAIGTAIGRPILVVLSTCEDAKGEYTGLTKLLGDVGRRLAGGTVELELFSGDEVRALVQEMAPWCDGEEQLARLARRVDFETGGDPFLTVSLLRGLAEVSSLRGEALVWPLENVTLETPVPFDIPQLVKAATMERVQLLSATAKDVLVGTCVGGSEVQPDVLSGLLDIATSDIEDALAQLERHHIVSFDGDRYFVEAALLREVVLSELLTPGQRKRLEQRHESLRHQAG